MELRTVMKLHFAELNRKGLELINSTEEEDYEHLKAIENTASEMYEAFEDAEDKELCVGVQCVLLNIGNIKKYNKNKEHEFELYVVRKNDEGQCKVTLFDTENKYSIDGITGVFRLFDY